MILATTDTLPRPYDILGVVQVIFPVVGTNSKAVERHLEDAKAELARRASGADAVIGLRIDEAGLGQRAFLSGTAIKFRA